MTDPTSIPSGAADALQAFAKFIVRHITVRRMSASHPGAWPRVLALATTFSLCYPWATAAEPSSGRVYTRSEVAGAIADFRKIVSGHGVEEQLEISVGDTKQWITVRGRDRRNPILLVIHGGPASPETPISWAYQAGWEDYFTVVQWDQRGSGKSFNSNDPERVKSSLSLARIVDDAAEVVDFLRRRYDKPKVFVLGHSWGSEVGLSLAHRHPEQLYAYVGMGQIVSGQENERAGYAATLRIARAAGNAQAVQDLESLAPFPNLDGTVPLAKIDLERKWSVFYGGLTFGRSTFKYYGAAEELSPDYTEADLDAVDKGSALSLQTLLPDMVSFDFRRVVHFKTPIVIFAGRHDLTTPAGPVVDWLARVSAPKTKIVWFDNSAHMMSVEEPGRVLIHLVEDVLPFARQGSSLSPSSATPTGPATSHRTSSSRRAAPRRFGLRWRQSVSPNRASRSSRRCSSRSAPPAAMTQRRATSRSASSSTPAANDPSSFPMAEIWDYLFPTVEAMIASRAGRVS